MFFRIKLFFREDKELYLSLYRILGFFPDDIEYYKLALKHKSKTPNHSRRNLNNNERLEFLGDAILGATVGDIVYHRFPKRSEGFLTNTRSKIVQRHTLGKVAKQIGLSALIKSKIETNAHNSYLEGNAFEALIGAIYLDKGYETCRSFLIKKILSGPLPIEKMAYKEVNFKSKLIELCQKHKLEFAFIDQKEDKDGSGCPVFEVSLLINGEKVAMGKGYTKKESQQMAARRALRKIKNKKSSVNSEQHEE